jgi:hypothetical protein
MRIAEAAMGREEIDGRKKANECGEEVRNLAALR